MNKHTPGPWEFIKGGSNITLAGSWAEDNSLGSVRSKGGWWIAKLEGSLPGDEEEQLANAHLIAAAPDLLEACRFIRQFLTNLESGLPVDDPLRAIRAKFHAPLYRKLDAAIFKASGVSA